MEQFSYLKLDSGIDLLLFSVRRASGLRFYYLGLLMLNMAEG